MSNSISTTASGGCGPASILKDGDLHVNLGGNVTLPLALKREAKAIVGNCPTDHPQWPFATQTTFDRRRLQPLTLLYLIEKEDDFARLLKIQDAVRQIIWRIITQIAKKYGNEVDLPVILFDGDLSDMGKRCGLELTFRSSLVFGSVRADLRTVTIETAGGKQAKFHLDRWSTTLPGSIMPCDVLKLPLTSSNSELILESLNAMTAGLGTVIGLANIEITSCTDGMSHPQTRTARAYLQLAPASMAVPFSSLVESLPTHFKWEGVPLPLLYSGRQLHNDPKHSDDYPLKKASNADNSASSSTPSTSASTESSSGGNNIKVEGSSDSNKRKRK